MNIIIYKMPPTHNINNNDSFTNAFNAYSNMIYRDGFIYGFITGGTVTSIFFVALNSLKYH